MSTPDAAWHSQRAASFELTRASRQAADPPCAAMRCAVFKRDQSMDRYLLAIKTKRSGALSYGVCNARHACSLCWRDLAGQGRAVRPAGAGWRNAPGRLAKKSEQRCPQATGPQPLASRVSIGLGLSCFNRMLPWLPASPAGRMPGAFQGCGFAELRCLLFIMALLMALITFIHSAWAHQGCRPCSCSACVLPASGCARWLIGPGPGRGRGISALARHLATNRAEQCSSRRGPGPATRSWAGDG